MYLSHSNPCLYINKSPHISFIFWLTLSSLPATFHPTHLPHWTFVLGDPTYTTLSASDSACLLRFAYLQLGLILTPEGFVTLSFCYSCRYVQHFSSCKLCSFGSHNFVCVRLRGPSQQNSLPDFPTHLHWYVQQLRVLKKLVSLCQAFFLCPLSYILFRSTHLFVCLLDFCAYTPLCELFLYFLNLVTSFVDYFILAPCHSLAKLLHTH